MRATVAKRARFANTLECDIMRPHLVNNRNEHTYSMCTTVDVLPMEVTVAEVHRDVVVVVSVLLIGNGKRVYILVFVACVHSYNAHRQI